MGGHNDSDLISDGANRQQDINIAFVNAPASAGWAGYFWAINNFYASQNSPSNEALVFFMNTTGLLQSNINEYNSTLIHEAHHMINFYQSAVQLGKNTDDWYEETSAMMAEDIIMFDLIGYNDITNNLLPYYMNRGGNISLNNWGYSEYAHYSMGGSLGAFLNRRYGSNLYTQSITTCSTGAARTNSYACIDGLIKSLGGVSLADELARMGASLYAKLPASTIPLGVGYPTGTSNGFGLSAIDTSINTLATPVPVSGAFKSMSQTYLNEVQASGKTRYIRRNVVVPAGTTLYLVIR